MNQTRCRLQRGIEVTVMKDASSVVPNYGPVYAAALYPDLARLCIAHGYALAVHGSLARDFDVVAIPWAEPLAEPQEVIDAITREFVIREVGSRGHRLYGRLVYTLSIGHGECAVDFSFAPKGTHEAEAALNAERLEVIAAIARKEAAQAENATLREQLAAAQEALRDALPCLSHPQQWRVADRVRAVLNGYADEAQR